MKTKQIANDFNIKVINITENNLAKYAQKYNIEKTFLSSSKKNKKITKIKIIGS